MKKLLLTLLFLAVGCGANQEKPAHMAQDPDPAAPSQRIALTPLDADGNPETDKLARSCPGSNCVTTYVDMNYGYGWGVFGDGTYYGTYPTSIGTATSSPLSSYVPTLYLPRFAVSKAPISWDLDLDPSGTTRGVSNADWELAVAAAIEVLEDETEGTFERKTSGAVNIRWRFVDYTPAYERQRFYRIQTGNVKDYGSSIGPIKAYYRCYVDFSDDDMVDYLDQQNWSAKFLAQRMLLRTGYTCLGRGTDYFTQSIETKPHHIPGPFSQELSAFNGRMNADYDSEPFFDGYWPSASGNVPGFGHWAKHEHWVRNYYPHNL